MSGRSATAAVAGEWVAKAEGDLRAAICLVQVRDDPPAEAACFHAQQCAEKYIKAALVLRQIDVPRTHDIERLLTMLPAALRPRLTAEEQRRLAGYAVIARYPGSGEIPLAEARRAVAMARRVRRSIRSILPREVVRRKG